MTDYQLTISEHVPYVDPRSYGIAVDGVDPAQYFVTSGDAVEKTKVLERELWELAGTVKKAVGKSKLAKHKKLVAEVWSAAGKARALLALLTRVRGDAIFLECEWREHVLYVVPKNPRMKDAI